MSIVNGFIQVAGIDVDVVYKNIKNLHIGVYPPSGRVRVAAPERLPEEAIRLAIVQRLSWIKKQQERLRNADRQSLREMVPGESHYVWGSRLRLEVIEHSGRPRIETNASKLRLFIPPETGPDDRRRILDAWHRKQLKAVIPDLVRKWEPIIGQKVTGWTVRRMKTKWGSCNPKAGRISLNLELAKRHPGCLEYILVHEMTHLHERKHGDRFTALMDDYLPNWRALRDQLNQTPLAHEDWIL